jgi:hypothetical protein
LLREVLSYTAKMTDALHLSSAQAELIEAKKP